MISEFNQAPDEVVTEIVMSHQKRPWLIVEGATDALFFSTRKLSNSPIPVVVCGWENVRNVIDKVIQEGIKSRVLGFMDRDYREDLGVFVDRSRIVISDYRDLEVSMFESSALDRVIVEFGSAQKIPRRECGAAAAEVIREKIYTIACKLGRLRYFSLANNLNYPLKKLDYSKFINEKSLEIDEASLLQQINSKSLAKIDADILRQAFEGEIPARLVDSRYISSGHDLMELLGLSLKKMWGTNNSGVVSREKLESCFRIGYSDEFFFDSDMYKDLEGKLLAV